MQIDDNARAMIYRDNGKTTLLIAKKFPGCFGGHPDAEWGRELTDDEVAMLLENPWCMLKPSPAIRPDSSTFPQEE